MTTPASAQIHTIASPRPEVSPFHSDRASARTTKQACQRLHAGDDARRQGTVPEITHQGPFGQTAGVGGKVYRGEVADKGYGEDPGQD